MNRVTSDRDVGVFDARASGYESGRRGMVHREIADRSVRLALQASAAPRRILDIGCGTGYLLRTLAAALPGAEQLCGIDPAPSMVAVARSAASDSRISIEAGAAEALPWADAGFDLVISTTSFDHWKDQRRGLAECARVLTPDGCLVLVDLISTLLTPTLVFPSHRHQARTPSRVARLLRDAGFQEPQWRRVYALIINAAVARR